MVRELRRTEGAFSFVLPYTLGWISVCRPSQPIGISGGTVQAQRIKALRASVKTAARQAHLDVVGALWFFCDLTQEGSFGTLKLHFETEYLT
jgi:hypothetical protein